MRCILPIIALFMLGSPLAANPSQDGEAAFTTNMVERLKSKYPQANISSKKPLEISIKIGPKSSKTTMFLDRIYGLCASQNPVCENTRDRLIESLMETSGDVAFEPRKLRVIVRPADYVANGSVAMKAKIADLVTKPLVGDLLVLVVIDQPNTIAWATTKELANAKMSQTEAFERAIRNTIAEMEVEAPLRTSKIEEFSMISGNAYESSRLADHESWRALGRTVKGRLVVSVPSAETCLFADVSSDSDLAKFREFTGYFYTGGERQLSSALYQWTPTGWIALP